MLGQPAIGSVDPVYMQSPNMTCRVQEERQKAKGKRQKERPLY